MSQRIFFFLKYYLFCLLFFWYLKGLFILYHFETYTNYPAKQIFNIFFYGTRLDLSFSGYMSMLPGVLIAFSFFSDGVFIKKIIKVYTLLVLLLISIVAIVDLEIFKWWGFRIDTTLIKYLNTPKEAIASISVSPVFSLILLLSGTVILSYFFFLRFVNHGGTGFKRQNPMFSFAGFIVLLVMTTSLIIPIRGGFQLAPINQSSVYFTTDQFLNQAAINAPWNLFYSIIEKNHNETNPFIYQTEEEVEARLKDLYKKKNNVQASVLRTSTPNILLIIWESFTAKTVEPLGGKKGITPSFNNLIHEGILFDQIYASGDRSDKGLIAILSGYPAQSITSIMRKTTKTAKLPALSKTLIGHGYSTSFFYGGEPEFANIKSYLLHSQYHKLIGKEDFPASSYNSKWGAHDEVVFEKIYTDLLKEKQPFFATLFTLSSHEPFEIPIRPLLPGKDEESLFLNSMNYTDSCLGAFISKAKKEPWWDNTLVIITADHGHRLPGSPIADHLPGEFKIPMLWTGGALVKKDTVISTVGSQTDIAATLLTQLKINAEEYRYSRDLLAPDARSFAYYAFNNGFGFMGESGRVVFDNVSKNYLLKDSTVREEDVLNGKAYLQHSYQDYLNK